MSISAYNPCPTEYVTVDRAADHTFLTSFDALDVVGFAQFKQKYEQEMEK